MNWRGLTDLLRSYIADRRDEREVWRQRAVSPEVVASLARDAGTTTSELQRIAAAGRHAARLRERMVAAFDIQPKKLSSAEYGALRQTGVTCSLCDFQKRCAIELNQATARANASDFCPNASTFDALAPGGP